MTENISQGIVGAVVIGRNEGERLQLCLRSLLGQLTHVVYVDSGSTDGSVAFGRSLGVEVVELDMARPFTAARARNAGFERLLQICPNVQFVQFVDGDCEVVAGWIDTARAALDRNSALAVVCGRRRERYPDASVYNRLCDLEWDTPIGAALACGGDALMRVTAFRDVGGYNPTLIAGEEPELCVRLRAKAYQIERIDAEMTLHDAAMTELGQWWKRAVRAGHAFAEGAHLHGAPPANHWKREARRTLLWGGVLPTAILASMPLARGLSLLLLLGYPTTAARVYQHARRTGRSSEDALTQAAFVTLAKFPEFQGLLRFHLGRLFDKRSALIEYKRPA